MRLHGETVYVLTPPVVTDRYGDTVIDWSLTPDEHEQHDTLLEPRPSGEDAREVRNQVTSGFTAYIQEPFPALTPQHRIRIRGSVHEILGEPADWRFRGRRVLVAQCEKVAG
jgi:hypothetical protein